MGVLVSRTGVGEVSVTVWIVAGVAVALLVCSCVVLLRRRARSRG